MDISPPYVLDPSQGLHPSVIPLHLHLVTARYIKDTAITNEAMARFLREDSASREILQV